MGGFFESVFGLAGKGMEARQNSKAAREDKADRLNLIKSLDYEPMYASDTTPTYQRSQSPVARAYLESMLMGNNPDMTFSGRPNAQHIKADQQTAQNAMFGTPAERLAQSKQIQSETPWKVTTPTRTVTGAPPASAARKPGSIERMLGFGGGASAGAQPVNSATASPMGNNGAQSMLLATSPRFAEAGGSPQMYEDLVSKGLLKKGQDITGDRAGFSQLRANPKLLENAYKARDYGAIETLLKKHPFDTDIPRGMSGSFLATLQKQYDDVVKKYGG